jgi:raffinose/stachyose/melibiose transport system permease protein
MTVPQPRILPREVPHVQTEAKTRNRSQMWLIAVFLLPGAIIYTLFLIWPILQATYYSLFNWNGLGPATTFVGLDNYTRILNDGVFWQSVRHTLTIILLSLGVQLPLALLLAVAIGRRLAGSAIFRTIFFLPYVFSEVVTAIIWSFVYTPDGGMANTVLTTLVPGFQAQAWLGNKDVALFAVFVVITWKYFGLHMILYMAALQQVPPEIEESARIDGANEWQVLRHITFPSMGTTIRLTIYLSVVGSLNLFVLIWILTTGGPVNATHVLATYMYRFGPLAFKYGYGTAVAIIIFAVSLVFSILYQTFVMRRDYAGEVA